MLKKILVAVILGILPPVAALASPWVGKLDLAPDFAAFGSRSFTSNEYIAGASKPLWTFSKAATPEFTLDGWVAFRASGGVLGGLQFAVPGGGFQQVAALFTSNPKIAQYASYVKDGVDLGYDPTRLSGLNPAWKGYFVSVALGGN